MSTTELKKALKNDVIFGTDRVIKRLKLGKLKKVFLAKNCKEDVKEDVLYYAKLAKIDVIELKIPNDEVGMICRKPFSISVLGY